MATKRRRFSMRQPPKRKKWELDETRYGNKSRRARGELLDDGFNLRRLT